MRGRWLGLALAGGLLAALPHAAQAADCGALARLKLENVNLLSAADVPASGDLPAYCRVLGYVRPAINFEIRLPAEGWNGKFYEVGCGGFCGMLLSDAPGFTNAANYGLRRRYATATMDSGHWGAASPDGRWAYANPVAKVDWATRSVPEVAKLGKALVRAFYGRAQDHAYFAGCSTGGRMAAMEASRKATAADFDGVIVGAPALDYTGLVATAFAWVVQANTWPDGKPILSAAKAKLAGDAAYAACDAKDGAKDGLIADPRRCDWKPAALQCKPGANSDADCLTAQEVGVLDKWYAGPRNSRGEALYPGGLPVGSEPNWGLWMFGAGPVPAFLPRFAQDFLRYMAFEPDAGPTYEVRQFDFDRDPARLAAMAGLYNATTFDPAHPDALGNTDFADFRQAGGKMIVYHGWADPLVTPFLTVAWYDAIARANGGADKARDFARLFMVPGMDHCGINTAGPGIADTGIDPLTALERWVEQGEAPDALLATKADAQGHTAWSRPVCAWPMQAAYGGGDPKEPGSFRCEAPAP